MTGKLDIAFVLPVYNGEDTILETINSILNQTISNLRLIVLDNGSTDRTTSIVENVRDPRIKIIEFSHKKDLSESLNRAFSINISCPMCLCHADDIFYPEYAENILRAITEYPEVEVFFSNADIINEKGALVFSVKNLVKKVINYFDPVLMGEYSALRLIFMNTLIAPSACFVKGGNAIDYIFDNKFAFYVDVDLWCQFLFDNRCLRVVKKSLIGYRVHAQQQSASASVWIRQSEELKSLIEKHVEKSSVPSFFKSMCFLAFFTRYFIKKITSFL